MMHLDTIIAHKRRHWHSVDGLGPAPAERPQYKPAVRGRFREALDTTEVSVIAEVKPKSPSKGDLWSVDKALPLAAAYQTGGAGAISVLADTEFFGGGPGLVAEVAATTDIPVLYKDFVVDLRQIELAHRTGADGVLVIVRALDRALLRDVIAAAAELGLDPLVETFTEDEIARALDAGADLIGINNRDLQTFEVDLENSARLHGTVPEEVVTVSESGIRDRADVEVMAEIGFNACLVGETLLTSGDPAHAVASLTGVSAKGRKPTVR